MPRFHHSVSASWAVLEHVHVNIVLLVVFWRLLTCILGILVEDSIWMDNTYDDIFCVDVREDCVETLDKTPDMCTKYTDYAWHNCRRTCGLDCKTFWHRYSIVVVWCNGIPSYLLATQLFWSMLSFKEGYLLHLDLLVHAVWRLLYKPYHNNRTHILRLVLMSQVQSAINIGVDV